MDAAIEREVRSRAGGLREYCRFPQMYDRKKFHLDHIIAEKHGGLTIISNLALCCTNCNFLEGPNLAGIDPKTRRMARLFSPRRDRWDKHFRRMVPS